MCKGPEVGMSSLSLKTCQKAAWLECREKGAVAGPGVRTVGRDRDRQLLKFCHLENGAVWFVLQTGLSVMNESKIPSVVRSAEYTVGVENCE